MTLGLHHVPGLHVCNVTALAMVPAVAGIPYNSITVASVPAVAAVPSVHDVFTAAGLPALAGVFYFVFIPAVACIIAIVCLPAIAYVSVVAYTIGCYFFFLLLNHR